MNFQKKNAKSQTISDVSTSYVVDVLLNASTSSEPGSKPTPCASGEKGEMQVRTLLFFFTQEEEEQMLIILSKKRLSQYCCHCWMESHRSVSSFLRTFALLTTARVWPSPSTRSTSDSRTRVSPSSTPLRI